MALNTRIRGAQINLADAAIDVTADSLAFSDADDGVIKLEAVDDFITGIAGDGLANSSSQLALDLNELTEAAVAVADDYFAFVDNDDNSSKKESIADLVTAMAGSGLTATNGVLSVDAIAANIVEGDIQKENLSSQIDATGYAGDFTVSNTPLANSLQVYLNGLLQEEGTGKDYTISGTTITFATAPVTNDIVIVYYIIDN